jgi:hypothetical protein
VIHELGNDCRNNEGPPDQGKDSTLAGLNLRPIKISSEIGRKRSLEILEGTENGQETHDI